MSDLDDRIDDIVLAPAEWQADDYFVAKGLLKALIEAEIERFAGEVKTGIIGSSAMHPLYANMSQEHAVNDARNVAVGVVDAALERRRAK